MESINENILKTEINKVCRTCLKVSQKVVLQPIHANNQNTVFMLTNLNILQVRFVFFYFSKHSEINFYYFCFTFTFRYHKMKMNLKIFAKNV